MSFWKVMTKMVKKIQIVRVPAWTYSSIFAVLPGLHCDTFVLLPFHSLIIKTFAIFIAFM